MNLGSVINVAKFLRGHIIETNCIFENTPPPHFGLDVVYKIGGRINGTLRYMYVLLNLVVIKISNTGGASIGVHNCSTNSLIITETLAPPCLHHS